MSDNETYSGRYCVIGPPGTGKTTFLARQVETIVTACERPMMCSLTKAAEREISARELPVSREAVGTLHAHALRAIGRPKVITAAAVREWNNDNPDMMMTPRSATSADDDHSHMRGGEARGDKLAETYDFYRHWMVNDESPRWTIPLKVFRERWEDFKTANEMIDFTDMIVIAHRDAHAAPTSPNVIMADEAQDLSRLECSLLESWGRWANALIVVGDPWQALYTWRGADPSLFDPGRFDLDKQKTLSKSYRVPSAVRDISMQWATGLSDWREITYEPRDGDPGLVESFPATIKTPARAVDVAMDCAGDGRSVMFIASANYMLQGVIDTLRARSQPFSNPWREYRKDWNPLAPLAKGVSAAARISAYTATSAEQGFERCEACAKMNQEDAARCWVCDGTGELPTAPHPWSVRDVARWVHPIESASTLKIGAKKKITTILEDSTPDAAIPIATIVDLFEPQHREVVANMALTGEPVGKMLAWFMPRLLKSSLKTMRYPAGVVERHGRRALELPPRIHVGTAHSFKGGEADVVFLFPDISYAAFTSLDYDEGRDAVIRTFYVAMTRARHTLYICHGADAKAVNLWGPM